MATIKMRAPDGTRPGAVITLSDGSTITVLSGGIASATPQQWQAARLAGFLHDDATQPDRAPFLLMTVPATGVTSGTVTAPDGTTITITAGKAYIPRAYCLLYQSYGWGFAPGHDVS